MRFQSAPSVGSSKRSRTVEKRSKRQRVSLAVLLCGLGVWDHVMRQRTLPVVVCCVLGFLEDLRIGHERVARRSTADPSRPRLSVPVRAAALSCNVPGLAYRSGKRASARPSDGALVAGVFTELYGINTVCTESVKTLTKKCARVILYTLWVIHPCALLCQRLHTLCDRYVLYSTYFEPMSCLQGLSGPLAVFSCTLVRGYLPVIYHPHIYLERIGYNRILTVL